MVKVFAMNVSGLDVSDERLLLQMSEKRLEKINRLKPENSKKQSMGAELLLNYAVNGDTKNRDTKYPVNWDTDESGKLYLPDCEFHVNLSHSGDYAVCAVSEGEVGVDIERVKKADIHLAKRFFTAEEYDYIKNSVSPDDAFFEMWVKKESFIKAVGKGLAIPLSSFCVLSEAVEYEGRTYQFKRYSIKDKSYKLCVCFAV